MCSGGVDQFAKPWYLSGLLAVYIVFISFAAAAQEIDREPQINKVELLCADSNCQIGVAVALNPRYQEIAILCVRSDQLNIGIDCVKIASLQVSSCNFYQYYGVNGVSKDGQVDIDVELIINGDGISAPDDKIVANYAFYLSNGEPRAVSPVELVKKLYSVETSTDILDKEAAYVGGVGNSTQAMGVTFGEAPSLDLQDTSKRTKEIGDAKEAVNE